MDAVNTQIEELLGVIEALIEEVESEEENVESLKEEIELRKVGLNVLRFDRLALWFFRFGSRHVHEVNTLLTDAEIMMDDIAIVIRAKHHV